MKNKRQSDSMKYLQYVDWLLWFLAIFFIYLAFKAKGEGEDWGGKIILSGCILAILFFKNKSEIQKIIVLIAFLLLIIILFLQYY